MFNFLLSHIHNAPRSFKSKFDLIDYSLQAARKEGVTCEFGVYKGNTINYIARKVGRAYGFDSFEGLPEDWRQGFKKGAFSFDKNTATFEDNVIVYPGWFKDSIPVFIREFKPTFMSFLHVDCDLYSSTMDVFELLGDTIRVGTVIQFDEFYNYPEWEKHEARAFLSFLTAKNYSYEVLGTTFGEKDGKGNSINEQVSFKIIAGDA